MSQPKIMSTHTQELIDDAHLLGWSIHHFPKSGKVKDILLVSPINSEKKIRLNPEQRQWNDNKLVSMHETLHRYSDPDKVEHLQLSKAQYAEEAEQARAQERERAEKVLQEAQERVAAKGRPTLVYSKESIMTQPHVIKTEPWLAGGLPLKNPETGEWGWSVYNSPFVIQRTWSDGHIDFACSAEGCEYFNLQQGSSVSNHYSSMVGRSPDHIEHHKPSTYWVKSYSGIGRTKQKRRQARKATPMDTHNESPTPYEPKPVVASTLGWEVAEETLAKIRELVGSSNSEEIAQLKARISELEDEMLDAMEAKEKAETEAAEIRNAWAVMQRLASPPPAQVG